MKGWILDFHLCPILDFTKDIGLKDGYWIFIYFQSLPSLKLLDAKSCGIEIPSFHCSIAGRWILRNRDPIPSIANGWMKNRERSKYHLFDTRWLDVKSREIEIPSIQYLIVGWKVLRNRNPIISIGNYLMKNRQKSKSHPSIARSFDGQSSEIEIPSI